MTATGKDYGLPEEYHDWVEWDAGRVPYKGPILRITAEKAEEPDLVGTRIGWQVSLLPPRPAMPDVAVGGIVDYWTREGLHRRVIRTNTSSGWMTSDGFYVRGDDLLIDVNDDGFTVVLEGL